MDLSLLTQLTEAPGVSGCEEQVRKLVAAEFARLGAKPQTDALGNLIGHLPGKGPRVALIAHMDEVGFVVSKIESGGFIRVSPVGSVDPRVFSAQQVMVYGRKTLCGIVGSVPPHLQKKSDGASGSEAMAVEESFIDLGLPEEEIAQVVRIGDPVTFATKSWENEHSFFGKALDDRVGLFVMLTAVRKAAKIDCDLILIASSQEEFGLRGAGPAVFSTAPGVLLALEGAPASDTPGVRLPANVVPTTQGKGPEIRLTDVRMISDRGLADFLVRTAEASTIPHQVIVKRTGATDAAMGQITGAGARVCTLSVPVRYAHGPQGLVRKTDIHHTVDLVAAFLERAASA
jgi:tetrahedral aminopeptidase